jgi:hypothetical protein
METTEIDGIEYQRVGMLFRPKQGYNARILCALCLGTHFYLEDEDIEMKAICVQCGADSRP